MDSNKIRCGAAVHYMDNDRPAEAKISELKYEETLEISRDRDTDRINVFTRKLIFFKLNTGTGKWYTPGQLAATREELIARLKEPSVSAGKNNIEDFTRAVIKHRCNDSVCVLKKNKPVSYKVGAILYREWISGGDIKHSLQYSLESDRLTAYNPEQLTKTIDELFPEEKREAEETAALINPGNLTGKAIG